MVLLAFDNLTGDAVFDATIPLGMSVQLEQSPCLRLLSADHIQETLRMMQRPPDTPLTRAGHAAISPARRCAAAVVDK